MNNPTQIASHPKNAPAAVQGGKNGTEARFVPSQPTSLPPRAERHEPVSLEDESDDPTLSGEALPVGPDPETSVHHRAASCLLGFYQRVIKLTPAEAAYELVSLLKLIEHHPGLRTERDMIEEIVNASYRLKFHRRWHPGSLAEVAAQEDVTEATRKFSTGRVLTYARNVHEHGICPEALEGIPPWNEAGV